MGWVAPALELGFEGEGESVDRSEIVKHIVTAPVLQKSSADFQCGFFWEVSARGSKYLQERPLGDGVTRGVGGMSKVELALNSDPIHIGHTSTADRTNICLTTCGAEDLRTVIVKLI